MPLIHRPKLKTTNFHGMVARSPQMERLFVQLGRAANSDINVLLRGESGTGKDLAAQALHAAGARAQHPFRAVNCASFGSELLASELFGHVKGAFTGAVRSRDGLMLQAHQGTLFLDEVAEIPLDVQGRLLRVLQDRRFFPVGGSREVSVDLRIVSATNSSLRELVAAKRFREDLMYRLRVVVVRLPALRERDGDLELLTWTLIDKLNRMGGRQVLSLSQETWRAMQNYSWPGNIRELDNVLQSAFVLGEGQTLTLDELSPELRGEGPEVYSGSPEAVPETVDLAALERTQLVQAWQEHGGRRGAMAEALGVSRSTLYRKLKEHALI
jgi:two-component system response regulator AtoC